MRSLKLLCIVGYLLFMGLAFDNTIVDALVFYVSDENGAPVMKAGKVKVRPLARSGEVNTAEEPVAAVQFQSQPVNQMQQAAGNQPALTMQMAQPRETQTTVEMKPVTPAAAGKAVTVTNTAAMPVQALANTGVSKTMTAVTAPATVSTKTLSTPVAAPQAAPSTPRLAALVKSSEPIASDAFPNATKSATNSDNPAQTLGAKNRSELIAKLESLRQRTKTTYATVAQPESAAAPASEQIDFAADLSGNPEVLADLPPADTSSGQTDSAVSDSGGPLSIVQVIKSLPLKPWEFDAGLNRYVVRYDQQTTVILTLRPALQRLVEQTFRSTSCRLGAAVIQDPTSGAILAMTSFDGQTALSPVNTDYVNNNWALKATFPIASIFKIITAAAAFDKRLATPDTRVKIGRKAIIELWRAFAKSHNGTFAAIGRKVGRQIMQATANAFGFNQAFYFDLPVTQSVAQMPDELSKLGEASAGLNKTFDVSPLHVSSIVSTILNDGKMMKPYLVEAIMHQGKVVFRRKSFQLGRPVTPASAQQIVRMMKTTTTDGTGKKGFNGYFDCPVLASQCGGKTGTLTGVNPHLLFTWWGGFTQIGNRLLAMTVLVGQPPSTSRTKAPSVAGRLAYSLLNNKPAPAAAPIVTASRKHYRRKR